METSVWGGGGTRCGVGEGTVTTHPSSLPPGTDPALSMSSQGSSWRGPSPSLAQTPALPWEWDTLGDPQAVPPSPAQAPPLSHLGDPPCFGVTVPCTEGSMHHPGGRSGSPPATLPCPPLPRFGQPCQASPAPGYPAPQAGAACHAHSSFPEDLFSSPHPGSPSLPPFSLLV